MLNLEIISLGYTTMSLGRASSFAVPSHSAAHRTLRPGWLPLRALGRFWPWLSGLAAALLLLGPGIGPGSLLSLDLLATPEIPFPDAALGLGPELPRRVPLGVPLSWASGLIGGAAATKLLIVVAVAAAFAGAVRLARSAPPAAAVAGGMLYALGPFAATRLAAGHLGILATMGVLPWALPRLLRPSERPERTFLWLSGLAVTGVVGGSLGLATVVAGLAFEPRRRPRVVLSLAVLAQLPWLVPGLLVRGDGLRLAGGEAFATAGEGPFGVVGALLAQHGFWRGSSQVGGEAGFGLLLVGAGLLALALFGHSSLPEPWRRPLGALAVVGFVVAAGSALPGFEEVHDRLTSLNVLAPFRESQRALILSLVWLAPAAALGVTRLARAEPALALGAPALLVAASVALAWPGLWGIEGRLEPVDFPAAWAQARTVVRQQPGTVFALPWHEYMNLGFADQRRVLNPIPNFFGGDVVSSHDPELGGSLQESVDPREREAAALAERIVAGEAVGVDLPALGVRWVVLTHEADWDRYRALQRDPALDPVVRSDAIDLFEVVAPALADPVDPRGGRWRIAVALTGHLTFLALVAAAWRRSF